MRRVALAGIAIPLLITAVSCSSSGSSTGASSTSPTGPTSAAGASSSTGSTPTPTPTGGVDPNAPEVVEPGDIPDDQVFVRYTSPDRAVSVSVPEGWARTEQGGAVTFTDKYNSVTIRDAAGEAPTIASVTAGGLADVSSDPTFTSLHVTPIKRKIGDGVLATFEIGSAPNAVTGKKALLAAERYVFWRNGTQVVLTLSGAKGADDVDPWRTVSDSLVWA